MRFIQVQEFSLIFKYKAANLPIHARVSGIFVPRSQPRHWLYEVSEVKRDLLSGCVSRSVWDRRGEVVMAFLSAGLWCPELCDWLKYMWPPKFPWYWNDIVILSLFTHFFKSNTWCRKCDWLQGGTKDTVHLHYQWLVECLLRCYRKDTV